jgi:hypothetical protein
MCGLAIARLVVMGALCWRSGCGYCHYDALYHGGLEGSRRDEMGWTA